MKKHYMPIWEYVKCVFNPPPISPFAIAIAVTFAFAFLVVIPEGDLLLPLPFLVSSRTLSEVERGGIRALG
jgi:hypothetical protein